MLYRVTSSNNKPCIHKCAEGFLACRIAEHQEQESSLQAEGNFAGRSVQSPLRLEDEPTRQRRDLSGGKDSRSNFQRSLESSGIASPDHGATFDEDIHMSDRSPDVHQPLTQSTQHPDHVRERLDELHKTVNNFKDRYADHDSQIQTLSQAPPSGDLHALVQDYQRLNAGLGRVQKEAKRGSRLGPQTGSNGDLAAKGKQFVGSTVSIQEEIQEQVADHDARIEDSLSWYGDIKIDQTHQSSSWKQEAVQTMMLELQQDQSLAGQHDQRLEEKVHELEMNCNTYFSAHIDFVQSHTKTMETYNKSLVSFKDTFNNHANEVEIKTDAAGCGMAKLAAALDLLKIQMDAEILYVRKIAQDERTSDKEEISKLRFLVDSQGRQLSDLVDQQVQDRIKTRRILKAFRAEVSKSRQTAKFPDVSPGDSGRQWEFSAAHDQEREKQVCSLLMHLAQRKS